MNARQRRVARRRFDARWGFGFAYPVALWRAKERRAALAKWAEVRQTSVRPVTFRITREDGSVAHRSRPPDAPCPTCGQMMPPMMSAGGFAPERFTPEYDYYWCDACCDAFDFDEVPPLQP